MALRWFVLAFMLTSFFIPHSDGSIEDKLTILRERMRVLENRLSEDISLVRKELYSELRSVKESYGSSSLPAIAEDLDTEYEQLEDQANKIEQLKNQMDDLSNHIDVLHDGFRTEKMSMRDMQKQLNRDNNKVTDVIEGIAELKDNFKANIDGLKLDNVVPILEELKEILEKVQICCSNDQHEIRANDCSDLLRKGHLTSGVYEIYPDTLWRPVSVYCDMTTDGGGWTVFQRRCDGSENFYRPWKDYRFGFGNLSAEFWLGNEFIHRIMKPSPSELRIELEDFENDRRFAFYDTFDIMSNADMFKIHLENFSGNVSDSLMNHNGFAFSTFDKGPSSTCAKRFKGGFWYNDCHLVNVNGEYLKGEHESYANGVNWFAFRGYYYSLKFTEMKFRSK